MPLPWNDRLQKRRRNQRHQRSVNDQLEAIECKLDLLLLTQGVIMQELDDLELEVEATRGGQASVEVLIDGLSDKIDELVAQGGDPTELAAKLTAFTTSLRDGRESLAAKAMANPVP